MGHPPGVLVLTDPADQSVSVRSQAVDGRLEVVDLETDAAQTQLVGHRGGRSGLVVGPDEARELDPGSSLQCLSVFGPRTKLPKHSRHARSRSLGIIRT
jgi:hypothetical protein